MMKIFRIILRKKVSKMMTKTNQLANLIETKTEMLKIRKRKTKSSIEMILYPNQINLVKQMIAKSLIQLRRFMMKMDKESRKGNLRENKRNKDVMEKQKILYTTVLKKKNLNLMMKSQIQICLLYTSPSPRDRQKSRMPSSA